MTDSTWHDMQHAARIPDFAARNIRTWLIARWVAMFPLLALWHERARQRRALDELDDRLLRDIGITRLDARRESEKPFWR